MLKLHHVCSRKAGVPPAIEPFLPRYWLPLTSISVLFDRTTPLPISTPDMWETGVWGETTDFHGIQDEETRGMSRVLISSRYTKFTSVWCFCAVCCGGGTVAQKKLTSWGVDPMQLFPSLEVLFLPRHKGLEMPLSKGQRESVCVWGFRLISHGRFLTMEYLNWSWPVDLNLILSITHGIGTRSKRNPRSPRA